MKKIKYDEEYTTNYINKFDAIEAKPGNKNYILLGRDLFYNKLKFILVKGAASEEDAKNYIICEYCGCINLYLIREVESFNSDINECYFIN